MPSLRYNIQSYISIVFCLCVSSPKCGWIFLCQNNNKLRNSLFIFIAAHVTVMKAIAPGQLEDALSCDNKCSYIKCYSPWSTFNFILRIMQKQIHHSRRKGQNQSIQIKGSDTSATFCLKIVDQFIPSEAVWWCVACFIFSYKYDDSLASLNFECLIWKKSF